MFFPEGQIRVHLYGRPVDMRKSYDGLYALTRHELGQDPLSGRLFVFINRRATQIKVLYWDRTGFCLWAKRLEQGRFLSNWGKIGTQEMDWTGPDRTQTLARRYGRKGRQKALPAGLGERCAWYNAGMNSTVANRVLSLDEAATYRPQQIVDLSRDLANATHQIDWFKRQIFGQKSERRLLTGSDGQMSLGETLDAAQTTPPPAPADRSVAAHTRTKSLKQPDTGDDSLPFFDETRAPVEVIELAAAETEGLAPEDFEMIGHKNSFRLAQRPGSYVVLKYQRPVIKLKATQAILCAAAPCGIIDGSRADISFVAGLLIDAP